MMGSHQSGTLTVSGSGSRRATMSDRGAAALGKRQKRRLG